MAQTGKPMNTPHAAEQVFFKDPAIDRLLGVTMALATEVYVLRDRLRALEAQLAQHGAVDLGQLNQEAAPEELAQHQADRDAFVAHLLAPLLGQESSLGVKP
jgi:hypothetical protein